MGIKVSIKKEESMIKVKDNGDWLIQEALTISGLAYEICDRSLVVSPLPSKLEEAATKLMKLFLSIFRADINRNDIEQLLGLIQWCTQFDKTFAGTVSLLKDWTVERVFDNRKEKKERAALSSSSSTTTVTKNNINQYLEAQRKQNNYQPRPRYEQLSLNHLFQQINSRMILRNLKIHLHITAQEPTGVCHPEVWNGPELFAMLRCCASSFATAEEKNQCYDDTRLNMMVFDWHQSNV